MHTSRRPHRRNLRSLLLVATAALAVLSGCASSDNKAAHDSNSPPPASSAPPPGAVTRAQASEILDHYQEVNNTANATRDATLLATVEAGQLYARSKAEYQQYDTLSDKEKKRTGQPFRFTNRSFYIPAGGNWFAAEATTNGKNHTVMVFEKSSHTGDTWKKVISLFPAQNLPPLDSKNGLAVTAAADTAVGQLAPSGVTAAIEDLFATGGKKDGAKLSHTTASAKNILKTYKERGDELGPRAQVNFFPTAPLQQKVYTLRTRSGVLAIAPLAHKEEKLVMHSGLQITPGKTQSVYNKTPRAVVVDIFQGEAVVHLPEQGQPEILDYRYALVDSR